MKTTPRAELIGARYQRKMAERKALLSAARAAYTKAAAELDTLKAEVVSAIRGESAFSKEMLGALIQEAEGKCAQLQGQYEAAKAAYDEGQTLLKALDAQYSDMLTWSQLYDTASMEARKMIVSCLIRRVDVYRGYRLHIDFNIDFEQYEHGLDIAASVA